MYAYTHVRVHTPCFGGRAFIKKGRDVVYNNNSDNPSLVAARVRGDRPSSICLEFSRSRSNIIAYIRGDVPPVYYTRLSVIHLRLENYIYIYRSSASLTDVVLFIIVTFIVFSLCRPPEVRADYARRARRKPPVRS